MPKMVFPQYKTRGAGMESSAAKEPYSTTRAGSAYSSPPSVAAGISTTPGGVSYCLEVIDTGLVAESTVVETESGAGGGMSP